jgi:DNA-binding transcriptional regulator YdaS (Cro superfamily)
VDTADIIRRAGGPTQMGRIIGRHYTTVLRWQQVPAKHVPAIARATGIPRWEIRPDLYERPAEAGSPHQEAA